MQDKLLRRDEVNPTIEVVIKIASTLEVSLDYLVGKTSFELNHITMNRLQDIQKLDQDDKAHVFALIDAVIQFQKAKRVFAN